MSYCSIKVHELPMHGRRPWVVRKELCKPGEDAYKGRRGKFLHSLMAFAHSTWDVLINLTGGPQLRPLVCCLCI